MVFKLSVALIGAGLMLAVPVRADAACCDTHQTHAAVCCDKHHAQAPDVADILPFADPQLDPVPPVRQSIEVWFMRPTWIGTSIVQGRYVIEHDNDRMARGEPCTHVYAFDDRETPVATFHCTHLERDRAGKATVVLVTMPDGFQKLTEFQFAGEVASHGYPTAR